MIIKVNNIDRFLDLAKYSTDTTLLFVQYNPNNKTKTDFTFTIADTNYHVVFSSVTSYDDFFSMYQQIKNLLIETIELDYENDSILFPS